ncbi:heme-thiolate peroxidase [Boletus edulis]|nr:heme-thiolate peroxidase [Boletus edulis]
MKLQNLATLVALAPHALGSPHLVNFPEYRSLAGLSPQEVRAVARTFSSTPGAQPLPPPINDTSSKLVNDPEHPYMPLQPGDIRGPCPGLNTLASHGYLPRNGVATPAQIITATQEGFNMGSNLSSFITYGAFIVDGNQLTNLMSIGANTTTDNAFTPGITTHGNFEGDASTTRGDFYFGNNFSFNETLFDQLEYAANLVGNGFITVESAAMQKGLRINDSIARNPTFSFDTPRYLTAYAEATFPLAFFVSGQTVNTTDNLTLSNARSFFDLHKYPDGFYRRQGPYDFPQVSAVFGEVFNLIQVPPGANQGAGNFVPNPQDDGTVCYAYHRQLNLTTELYPNPTPELKAAIKTNLLTFYQTLQDPTCEQIFPYGQ